MKKFLSSIADDILLFAGAAFLFYGVWTIYPPAGFIVLGLWMTGIAILIAKRG
jgi:hypothetical protein